MDAPSPERLCGKIVRVGPIDSDGGYSVVFVTWDPDSEHARVFEHQLTVTYEDGGLSMTPGETLGDCLEVMAASQLADLLSPRLRMAWLTGAMVDEVMGTLARSGIFPVLVVESHDEE